MLTHARFSLLAALTVLLLAACAQQGQPTSKLERLRITTVTLPAGVVGAAYSAQLTATGGEAPYTFGVDGTLPAGLSLDPATGMLAGTPSAAFSGDIEFTLSDIAFTVRHALALALVVPAPLSLQVSLNPTFTGAPYTGSLLGSGGLPPLSYAVPSGQLPPGLSLDSVTGNVTGTATSAGIFSCTVAVLDSASQQTAEPVTIHVSQGALLSTAAAPDAFVGFDWYARIDASGGVAPYQFALSGAPAWMQAATMGDGWLELTGTPGAAGAASFTVHVTDGVGLVAQAQYGVQVNTPATSLQGDSQVVTTAVPRAVAGEYYAHDLLASGGFTVYYWSATGLPNGLYFDVEQTSVGKLRGRARVAGVYSVTVTANDSVHNAISSTFDLVVEPKIEPLPEATVGTDYDFDAAVSPGASVQPASLASASLECAAGSTVRIFGNPTGSGREAFALEVSAGGTQFIQLIGVDVRPAPAALQVVTSQLPGAVKGSGYDYRALLQAEGGGGSGYQWALVGGSLPPGLAGLPAIAGSATQTGSFQFTVEVTDSALNTAQATLTINVNPPRKGDVNGDGCPDLLVGSKYMPANGGVKLFYGEPAQARFGAISAEEADWTYDGAVDVCCLGDFNGDGIGDIVVSNRAWQTAPARVKLWYGSRTAPLYGAAGAPDFEVVDATTTDSLGSALAVGDLDGDGYDDLVIGARLADGAVIDGGAVYIFYGGPATLSGTVAVSAADARFTGVLPGVQNAFWGYPELGFLGDSLLVHDINGDGRADIVAGASSVAYILYSDAARYNGVSPITAVTDADYHGLVGSWLPGRLAIGDFNGDSYPDLAAAGKDSYVFYGKPGAYPLTGHSDTGGPSTKIHMPTAVSLSNYAGVVALDLNADGIDDLVFSSPVNAVGFLFYGSSTPLGDYVSYTAADIQFGFGGSQYAPWFVARLDANDDGIDDLMLGIHNWTAYTAGGPVYAAGGVAVIHGSSTNPPQGGLTPALTAGLRIIGQISSHGWGSCGTGG